MFPTGEVVVLAIRSTYRYHGRNLHYLWFHCRKPPPPRAERLKQSSGKSTSYEEVYNQSSPTNTTVYCGGFSNVNEDVIESTFSRFGHIVDIRTFKDKGYAFIKYVELAHHYLQPSG